MMVTRSITLWERMDFFSTQNILVHIPIGAGGYDLSWIEATGTLAGLLCIWLASPGENQ